MDANLPLLKEHRIKYIEKALQCFSLYPKDRERQKNCILNIYPGKSEKSVFRGMIIPTLRKLELIYGRGNDMQLTANGKLIVEAQNTIYKSQVIQTIFYEIDLKKFQFINIIKNNEMKSLNFYNYILKNGIEDEKYNKRMIERIESWLSILKCLNLVSEKNELLNIVQNNYNKILENMDIKRKHIKFIQTLILTFKKIVEVESIGMVDIAELRKKVAIYYFKQDSEILTESQFDELLKVSPKVTDSYIITLGQPIRPDEQLFEYRGNYYRTLNLKVIKEGLIGNE